MYRIMIAGFLLEANSFSNHVTTLADYRKKSLLFLDDIVKQFRGTGTEVGGFLSVLEQRTDVETVPVIYGNANPGAPMTEETYNYFKDAIVNGYKEASAEEKIDGILLCIHGAMMTETCEDGEGLLLQCLREVTGPDLPIVTSLDFHVNMTPAMVKHASAMFAMRFYPHTDCFEAGKNAAAFLLQMLDGKAHPSSAMKRIPLIYPIMSTDEGAIRDLTEDLINESRTPGVYEAFFAAGFCLADASVQGSAIYCLTENDAALADKICDKYYRRVMENIREYDMIFPDPEKACREAIASPGTTVLADLSDNPGSGLAGDATELVHLLIRLQAGKSTGTYAGDPVKGVAVGAIWDPETAEQAAAAGPGATIHVKLGGKSFPDVGAPLEIDACVASVSDGKYRIKGPMMHGAAMNTGLSAALLWEGFAFIVISNRTQTHDLQIFRHNGIDPLDYHIIVVKSAVHFRAAYKELDVKITALDMPNITSSDVRKAEYRNVPRPIFPLDDIQI